MGYTTTFEGQFTIDPPADLAIYNRVNDMDNGDDEPGPTPESYCQWHVSKAGDSLAWDTNEKFYNYVEWLQFLIDSVFAPSGRSVSGEVTFQGEEHRDTGTLRIVDGKAVKELFVPRSDFDKIVAWLIDNDHSNAAEALRDDYPR